MKTPVIIAARNEEQHIGIALDALSRQSRDVEPVVVVNGCIDKTADIAIQTGATVLESDEGKMVAIQQGLRHLGKRALDPTLILDADCRPLSQNWSNRLPYELTRLSHEDPSIVWGPYIFRGEINPVFGAFITAASMRVSWVDRHKRSPRTVRGGNTGLYLKEDEALESLLSLDNYWPREDVAIFDTTMDQGAHKKVIFHPDAWVITTGSRFTSIVRQTIQERRHPSRITDDSYAREAPPNSRPYDSAV